MKDYRIAFEKRGRVRYISHLDLNRCMLRAVRRSGLPAWYTEGFHPHMYLMFPLALSLGTESICEVMDIRLTEEVPAEEISDRLNAALPEGLRVFRVGEPTYTAQDVAGAEYRVTLCGEGLLPLFDAFLAQEQIIVEKKTKKGMKEIDVKPMVTVSDMTADGGDLHLTLRLPAGNEGNINVSVITDAFEKYAGMLVPVTSVLRTKIFCADGKVFF